MSRCIQPLSPARTGLAQSARRCFTLLAGLILALCLTAGSAPADPPASNQPAALNGVPQPIATVKLKPGEVPSIVFDTPVYNFGRIVSGQDVVQDFWFTNKGTGPLEILAIRPSCGCTTTGDFDRVVQPGGRGKIPIKVATGKFNGPVVKTVTVQTNVPGPAANALITIQGDLWQPISVQPDSVFLGRILESEANAAALVQSVSITTTNNAVARLSAPRSNNPVFRAEARKLEAGRRFTVTVFAVPPIRSGNNYGTIEIDTGLADMPTVRIPVTLIVAPELEVAPQLISFSGPLNTPIKRFVSIRNNVAAPLRVSGATCNNRDVRLEFTEVQPGVAWQLVIDIPAGYRPADPGGDKITLRTSKAGSESLSIPIVEVQPFIATTEPASQTAVPARARKDAAPGSPKSTATKTRKR